MKTLRLISMFFICAALSAGVASCGGDDDNEVPKPVNPVNPDNGGNSGSGNNVSGIQVQTLEDLRQLTGYRFRLATEEEWQYAARGGNKSKGYTYSGSNNIGLEYELPSWGDVSVWEILNRTASSLISQ